MVVVVVVVVVVLGAAHARHVHVTLVGYNLELAGCGGRLLLGRAAVGHQLAVAVHHHRAVLEQHVAICIKNNK